MPLVKTPSDYKSDLYKMDSFLQVIRLSIVTYSFKRFSPMHIRFGLASRKNPLPPTILFGLMIHIMASILFMLVLVSMAIIHMSRQVTNRVPYKLHLRKCNKTNIALNELGFAGISSELLQKSLLNRH